MTLYLAVFCGGLAALTWEILWVHFASLAIGVSAKAAAITLSAMMLGMMMGSWASGNFLARHKQSKALRLLAGIEVLIGTSGLLLPAGFCLINRWTLGSFMSTPRSRRSFRCWVLLLFWESPHSLWERPYPSLQRSRIVIRSL